MKKQNLKIIPIILLFIPFRLFAQTSEKEQRIKEISFTIPARGEKIYEIIVPEGAKKIEAVISDHSEMISMEISGPTNETLCKNSTWSNLSEWRKPLKCSASVVNNSRQKHGIWKIKIYGKVHVGKLDKIKSVSGKLTIKISGN